ncbi:hypothetical protein WJX73_002698 [Symbiochloris irregularis]|uniref:Uncharacterized protein n=1 Tax=Symbiochloris irregularis TaxID=706552 RepID=A0AAW1P5B5_9CHLO
MRENAASREPLPPLDIGHSKLIVWLVGRKLLPGDWHKRLNLVQKKVAQTVQQEPGQAGLGPEQARDYWSVLSLRDRLAESATKSLLGGLTGPAATWDKLVKAYESRNIFLGETALLLVRNSDYEAPFLKGQVQKHQQLLSDLERRQVESAKRSDAAATTFRQECQQLGITGLDISRELQKLPHQLPELMLAAIKDTLRAGATPGSERAPAWLSKLLDSPDARNALMDDLYELMAFLKQRQIESRAADTMAVVSPVSEGLQQVTASAIDDMLSQAQATLASLSTASMKQLLLIKTSVPYLQRLVRSLEQSADQELKLKRLGDEARRKYREVQQSLVEDSAKLADLKKTTSAAKAALEERLAALLNGRAVNITGVSAAC